MHALLGLLFFLSLPFWDAKTPPQWTDGEVETMLSDSPWAQIVGPSPEVVVYLATAAPVEEAETEQRLRGKHPAPEPDPDYLAYRSQHRDESLVLSIPYAPGVSFGSEQERRRMEAECEMIVDRKKHQIVGHFPPADTDPVLRLVFPRVVKFTDKPVIFQLYLPGIPFPEREVEFRVKDLMYRGKLEM